MRVRTKVVVVLQVALGIGLGYVGVALVAERDEALARGEVAAATHESQVAALREESRQVALALAESRQVALALAASVESLNAEVQRRAETNAWLEAQLVLARRMLSERESPKPQTNWSWKVDGVVERVDAKALQLSIDLGTGDGVRIGMPFHVYRHGTFVCTAVVESVEEDCATACFRLAGGAAAVMPGKGDRVRSYYRD